MIDFMYALVEKAQSWERSSSIYWQNQLMSHVDLFERRTAHSWFCVLVFIV
jgi:hypothetical protein